MSEEPFDRQTGELMPITTSPTRGHLYPISALPASADSALVWGAMIMAMQEMKQPRRTKKAKIEGQTKDGRKYLYEYVYSPIEEITKALKPALKPQGLWYQQGLVYLGRQPFIRTMVIHTSGQWTACDYPVFGEMDSRKFAGAVTMACRRGLMLMFGITPEDDNEEIHEDTPAKIREPRTQSRYASAFSKSHAPDEFDGKGSAEPQWNDLAGEGWMAADRGVATLEAFCARLTPEAKRLIGKKTYDQWRALARQKDVARDYQITSPLSEPEHGK